MKKKNVFSPVIARLTRGQVEALRRLHEVTRVPQAEYMREAVGLLLEKYKKLLK